ncbi:unnamed protein product [Alopecurus aequalis]
MDRGSVFAWMLVAGLLLASCTGPAACSARHLLDAAADIGDAKPWVAGERAVVARRVLGLRLTWPPPPVPNTPRASAAPVPPQGQY